MSTYPHAFVAILSRLTSSASLIVASPRASVRRSSIIYIVVSTLVSFFNQFDKHEAVLICRLKRPDELRVNDPTLPHSGLSFGEGLLFLCRSLSSGHSGSRLHKQLRFRARSRSVSLPPDGHSRPMVRVSCRARTPSEA
ncbi:MAG: hypothetical protein J07HQX50_00251 [Haloquadratum sp. J07HQX50]|nr:MAG: hypothetical protein J07HQX50_00251 [Haloquadratum sp. J07HQX50]